MNAIPLILATNNIHKRQELTHTLGHANILIPNDLGILDFDPIEHGNTFEQNAMIKAEALHNILQTHADIPEHYIILADDSGLCVEALGGEPGIFSARYAHVRNGDTTQGNARDEQNREALIQALQERGVWGSPAFFQCSIAYIMQADSMQKDVVNGHCHGVVAIKKVGANGFGYDCLFYRDWEGKQIQDIDFCLNSISMQGNLDSLQHSLATLSLEQKMAISHRGAAIHALKEVLCLG